MELRGETVRIAQPVLLIEHDEIESGEAQDLGDLRMTQHRPATEDVLAVAQALLEGVWSIHVISVNTVLYGATCPCMAR
jgi:hypothetical protein